MRFPWRYWRVAAYEQEYMTGVKLLAHVFLITLMPVGATLAQNNKAGQWRELVYSQDGFAITAPSPPTDIHLDPNGPEVVVYAWHRPDDITITVRAAHRKQDCTHVLARAKEGLPDNSDQPVTPGSIKDITLQGNPGLEYEYQYRKGRKAFERLYCTPEMAFALTASSASSLPRPAIAIRMFSSFRLLEKSE